MKQKTENNKKYTRKEKSKSNNSNSKSKTSTAAMNKNAQDNGNNIHYQKDLRLSPELATSW